MPELKQIGDECDAGRDVLAEQGKTVGQKNEPADQVGREQHDHQCRKYPPYPASVEFKRRKRAGIQLRQNDAGDAEARNHEEYIDADEATRGQPGLGVISDHQHDGARAQAVDVGAIRCSVILSGHQQGSGTIS
jgi:hypothetical protein